ncbi:hypothetical protein BDK51DRAFT_5480, partial [Blyttiomyces helicus]
FGHVNYWSLRSIETHVDGLPRRFRVPKEPEFCDGCAAGKAHREEFEDSTSSPTRPFELVSADLVVVSTPGGASEFRYFVVFVDHYTHYAYTVLLASKS